jgi:hypothetical protein
MSRNLKLRLESLEVVCRAGINAWVSVGPRPSFEEEMISEASRFMKQIAEEDGEDPWMILSERFNSATKPDGSFDRARISVLSMLSSLQKAAEQVLKEMVFDSPLINLAIVSERSSFADLDYISLIRNRLADPSWVPWHLSAALVDAQRLLEYRVFTSEQVVTLWTWRGAIRELQALWNEQPILGCHILRRCWESASSKVRPEPRYVLLTRLAEDPVHLFQATLSAARFLYDRIAVNEGEKSQHARNHSTDNVTHPADSHTDWFKAPICRINLALHMVGGYGDNPRNLQGLIDSGDVVAERISRQVVRVRFVKDGLTGTRVRNWLKDNPPAKKKKRGPQADPKPDEQRSTQETKNDKS